MESGFKIHLLFLFVVGGGTGAGGVVLHDNHQVSAKARIYTISFVLHEFNYVFDVGFFVSSFFFFFFSVWLLGKKRGTYGKCGQK